MKNFNTINYSYEQEFKNIWRELAEKYQDKMFDLDGIGEQLDLAQFSKNFYRSGNAAATADASVDANANISEKSIITYNYEWGKPLERFNSYYLLWKTMRKIYDAKTAAQALESSFNGDLYINDQHGISGSKYYCFNYSTYDVMTKGLPFVSKIKSFPPKYLYAFKSQIEQFLIIAGGSSLGATGIADLLAVWSLYSDRILEERADGHFKFASEEDCWIYIRESLVSLIYTLNQPLRCNQSLFTNVSVFDKYFIESIVGDYIHPITGAKIKIDILQRIQEMYLDIMNEEMKRTPITFPVTTACFSVNEKNEIRDEEFLSMIARKSIDYAFINFYCGKTSTLSSCCFSGEQKVLTRSSSGVSFKSIKEVVDGNYFDYRRNFTVFHNGSWCSARPVKVKKGDKKMIKVSLSNKKEILVTDDHIHLTLDGDKSTNDLSTSDYLAFSTRALDYGSGLSYEQGFLIGLYIGDGSKYKRKDCDSYSITFSLNESNLDDIEKISKALKSWNIDKELHIHHDGKLMSVVVYSQELFEIIGQYVSGDYAWEKSLNPCTFDESKDFRTGIRDGWYASDGGNSNRIYTTSNKLIEDGEALFTTLGLNTNITISDRTGEGVVTIDGESYNRNYPLYCIRWYSSASKRGQDGVFKIKNNTEYFKISSIEEVENSDEYVYCFEMSKEGEPYFTLPNGIITHNCRLRSEMQSEYFNSFGSGGTKIGSLSVCTVNLPRIAFEAKGDKDKMLATLQKRVDLCFKINYARRKLIQEKVESGFHPLYTFDFVSLKSQYSTCGVNGFNEAIEIMGKNPIKKDGIDFGLEIIDVINKTNDALGKHFNVPVNCEQIPAENVSIKLAQKDRVLGINDRYDIYSNQFIPLTNQADLLDRVRLQGIYDSKFSGGAIAHLNVGQKITDSTQIEALIKKCATSGVIYFAINYVILELEDGTMTVGNRETKEVGGKKVVNYFTRVVGFMVNVKHFSKERREKDFPNRKFYSSI